MIRVFAAQIDLTNPDKTRNNLNLLENEVNTFVRDPAVTIVSQRHKTEEWVGYADGLIMTVLVEYNIRHR